MFDEYENEKVYEIIRYILEELINGSTNQEWSISFIKEMIFLRKDVNK